MSTNMPTQDQPAGETDSAPSNEPVYRDWRSARRAERARQRAERRAWRVERYGSFPGARNGGWIVGAVLVLLGLLFLLQNTGILPTRNWNWLALLLFIPALAALGGAWFSYNVTGSLDRRARSGILWGLALAALATALFFNLGLGLFLPLLLIVGGAALFINTILPD